MIFKVTFLPLGRTVEVDSTRPTPGRHGHPGCLLEIALANDVHIEHACGGVGVCGTCHVIVDKGMENFSPATDDEMDVVDQAPNAGLNSRLACMAVPSGDVTVTVPAWNRNAVPEKSS